MHGASFMIFGSGMAYLTKIPEEYTCIDADTGEAFNCSTEDICGE